MDGNYSAEEQVTHVEQDFLVQELSNITQKFNSNGNLVYGRIVQKNKRDRATSLMYGLSVVYEYEKEGKAQQYKPKDNSLEYLKKYIF